MSAQDQIIMQGVPAAQSALSGAGPWGAAASAALGVGQLAYGLKKSKDASRPDVYDPRIMTQITDLNRRRANLGTGAAFSSDLREAMTQRGSGLRALARSGNLNQYGILDRISASNINKAMANMQASEVAYTGQILALEKAQAMRKYSLDMQKYSEDKSTAEKMKRAGAENALAGAVKGMGPGDGSGGSFGKLFGGGSNSPDGATPGIIPGTKMAKPGMADDFMETEEIITSPEDGMPGGQMFNLQEIFST